MTNAIVNKIPDQRTYVLHSNSATVALGLIWTTIVFVSAGAVFIGLGLRYGFDLTLILAEILLVGLGVFGYLFTRRISRSRELAVSAVGIEYRDKLAGLVINTEWDNIEFAQLVPSATSYSVQLVLRQPVIVQRSKIDQDIIIRCKTIPLLPLTSGGNSFLADLKRFAPQVFEKPGTG